jgi:hypothetical protein
MSACSAAIKLAVAMVYYRCMQPLATQPGTSARIEGSLASIRTLSPQLQALARVSRAISTHGQLWFPSLLLLPTLYQLAFKQTMWVPTALGPARMSLIPVWAPLWYTSVWLLFAAIVVALFLAGGGARPTGANVSMRRAAVVGVGLIYTFELATRFATHHVPGGVELSPWKEAAVAFGLAAVVTLVAARPPRSGILVGLLFAGGLVLRLAGLAAVAPDPEFADNLPAIGAALDRLAQGGSPYGFYAFANHSTSMAYLPLTFLAYLPAHLLGLDLRITNIVLSLSEAAALLVIIRAVRVPEPARSGLFLLCAINYVLPLNLGHDLHNEFQMFDLALVVGIGLVVTNRFRPAAAALGIALGAMPTGLFCAAAILSYAARRIARPELARLLVLVACIAAVPLLAFVAHDPSAVMQAVTYEAGDQWGHVAGALDTWPYSPLWYGLGPSLKLVQLGLFVALACFAAARVRTGTGAAQLAALSYLLMLLTGPQSGSHILSVVVPLVIVAEAARQGHDAVTKRSMRIRKPLIRASWLMNTRAVPMVVVHAHRPVSAWPGCASCCPPGQRQRRRRAAAAHALVALQSAYRSLHQHAGLHGRLGRIPANWRQGPVSERFLA